MARFTLAVVLTERVHALAAAIARPAAHSKPLSACTFVRLFAGSARTAMTSGVTRSFTRPLEPSGRKIGSQYAERSLDSFASSCSSRFTDELFTQMKRAG